MGNIRKITITMNSYSMRWGGWNIQKNGFTLASAVQLWYLLIWWYRVSNDTSIRHINNNFQHEPLLFSSRFRESSTIATVLCYSYDIRGNIMDSFFKNIFNKDSGARTKSEQKLAGRSLGGTKPGRVIRVTISSSKPLGCTVSYILRH